MNTLEVAGLCFGQGLPKICVPLAAREMPELESQLSRAEQLPASLYELRADFLSGEITPALELLDKKASRPWLCTLRTKGQGGLAELSPEEYELRLADILKLGGFQFLDIELACGEERVARLAKAAREKGMGVIISQHDFVKTPDKTEMLALLSQMKALGADLPKLAVMPQSPLDVLSLMEVTLRAVEQLGPVITMSMGELGKASRVCGGLTGSCVTFGAGAQASAPGQISADRLKEILWDITPEERL